MAWCSEIASLENTPLQVDCWHLHCSKLSRHPVVGSFTGLSIPGPQLNCLPSFLSSPSLSLLFCMTIQLLLPFTLKICSKSTFAHPNPSRFSIEQKGFSHNRSHASLEAQQLHVTFTFPLRNRKQEEFFHEFLPNTPYSSCGLD